MTAILDGAKVTGFATQSFAYLTVHSGAEDNSVKRTVIESDGHTNCEKTFAGAALTTIALVALCRIVVVICV